MFLASLLSNACYYGFIMSNKAECIKSASLNFLEKCDNSMLHIEKFITLFSFA